MLNDGRTCQGLCGKPGSFADMELRYVCRQCRRAFAAFQDGTAPLVGDAVRDQYAQRIAAGYAAGYIDHAEMERRLAAVTAPNLTVTLARAAVGGLPPLPAPPRRIRAAHVQWAAATVLLWWAVTATLLWLAA